MMFHRTAEEAQYCFGGPGIDANKEPGFGRNRANLLKEVHVNTHSDALGRVKKR